jgi:serine/threonine protein kinase
MSEKEENSKKIIDGQEKDIESEKIINTTKEADKKYKLDSKKIIDEYLIKDTIGKGTFSTVKLGEHIKTKQKVAIKILNKDKIKAQEDSIRIKREIKILSMMDHPNIIKTYKITENAKNYYIIMEYCNGGELFNYIVEKEKLEQDEASMFFYQLINALEYIHSLGIAHRDLKPENLLLVENKIIKIIDFGLSNYFNGEKNLETPCGSPSYASPEIIKGEAYNGFYIDIWASGIIMFAMLCGYLPFDDDEEENEDDENEVNTSDNIKRSDRTSRVSNESEKSEDNEVLFQRILEGKLEFPSYLTPEAVDLMKKILVVDPTKRIEIKDIKKHKFYLIGQKNFLLNQKNISIPKVKKIKKIEKIEEQLNDTDNDALKDEDEFLNSLSKDLIHSIMDNLNGKNDSTHNIHNSNPNHDMNNSTNDNNKASAEVNKNEDGDKKNKVKVLLNKDDMEEYEKKLFENYLRNVAAIRRNNLLMNKLKKQNNPKNKKINKLKIYSNPLSINFNPLSIYSPGLHQNVRDIQNIPRVKKIKKNKNNYTLNEIVLNFNGNNSESYKELTTSISRRINNNYNINNYNILKTKIKPIIRKSYDYYKNNNMFYHIENNKSINKDSHNLLTINIPDEMSSKRRNYTENKLLKDVKYDRTNGNYKKFDESIRKYNYLKNPIYNSVEHIYENNLMRNNNRPILPLIKPSLFNIFSNINNQNKETSLLNPINRLKTEENNANNRKRFISIGNKIDYNVFWNNSNHSINNDFKYKLFLPSNKRYNISTLKGSYNFNI